MAAYIGLREFFPYCVDVMDSTATQIISLLIPSRMGASNGSSFAVTVNAQLGHKRIWLSEVSFHTIVGELGLEVANKVQATKDMLL